MKKGTYPWQRKDVRLQKLLSKTKPLNSFKAAANKFLLIKILKVIKMPYNQTMKIEGKGQPVAGVHVKSC